MGDLHVLLPQPGNLTQEPALPSLSLPSVNPHPSLIGDTSWRAAEQAVDEIICQIQPTVVSEQRRKAVVEYVQRLTKQFLRCEVFPFGSVPLKTYLPDGDIDLTALTSQNVEDALANDVCSVLEGEEQNKDAEFDVKDIQYIHAEVKLVKCIIQNIVVDISFNQLGGLCTLCFLEQVDRLIGKDHLFKRSIILIKAWCYYESRILGAHHGLISTYALETLVLYIFHQFHSSLNGPLAVLYRFLDYFSKFDWDNYGISLNGPVAVSSFPEIVAETPENDGGDVLLKKEFLRTCMDMFSVPPPRGLENNGHAFPQKHLNIVDPLKENNNLGRSVSKGNLYRIRSAFTFGARKLGRILMLSGERMAYELNKFFMNTLERHGSGQRPDVQDYFPSISNSYRFNGPAYATPISDLLKGEEKTGSQDVDSHSMKGRMMGDDHEILCSRMSSIEISGPEMNDGAVQVQKLFSGYEIGNERSGSENKLGAAGESKKYVNFGHSLMISEPVSFTESDIVSCRRLSGDATDLATSQTSSRITNEHFKLSTASNELRHTSLRRAYDAPHFYFSHPFGEAEKHGDGNINGTKLTDCTNPKNSLSCEPHASDEQPGQEKKYVGNDSSQSWGRSIGHADARPSGKGWGLDAYSSGTLYHVDESLNCSEFSDTSTLNTSIKERDFIGGLWDNAEASHSLSELSGEYESHFKNFLYGRWCHEYLSCGPVFPCPPSVSSSQLHNKSSWDSYHQPNPMKQNAFHLTNVNGAVPGPMFHRPGYYPVNRPFVSGAYSVDEMPKPRGTGTYFPNPAPTSFQHRERPVWRGRQYGPQHNYFGRHRNGRLLGPQDAMSSSDNGDHELLPHAPVAQPPAVGISGRGKTNLADFVTPSRPTMIGYPQTDGNSPPSERLSFGSLGPVQLVHVASSEQGRQVASGALERTHGFGSPIPKTGSNLNPERPQQSYHLKDEADFPPLSNKVL